MELNLTANGKAQELILAYLQENASEPLAEKINNGVLIEKDGKPLVSKKTLDGFMKYASDEARKRAEKGARSACVEDAVVYGWAIHYFEENSIEGTLFNEDGSEYKPTPKTTPKAVPAPAPEKKENPQMSLFNLLNTENPPPVSKDEPNEDDEDTAMEVDEETGEVIQPAPVVQKIKPFYAQYLEIKKEYGKHLLFQRLGNFYEAFSKDAETVSEVLNLTLTGRDVGLQERVALTGVPYHVAEQYFSKLVKKGYTVAAIENDETITTYPEENIDDEAIEELSQEEMRKFDGDIDTEPEDDGLDEEHLRTSFDKETMVYLYDLLDGKMDIK